MLESALLGFGLGLLEFAFSDFLFIIFR